ncbi:polymeric immunoglobulin receptor-like [Scleropages formosus]|nr:polymeric immunoglobulin receptor-like [Scleropages formosus]
MRLENISAQHGGSVTIPCHYDHKYRNHVKNLRKGYTWPSCSTMRKGDVSITDDPKKLVFYMTMRNLQEKDTDTYWYGRGGSVIVPCYIDEKDKQHVKYWCKGKTWSSCTTMVRSDSPQSKGDMSIIDDPDQLVFYVTMRNLQEENSDTYWCGVDTDGASTADEVDDGAYLYLTVTTANPGVKTVSWISTQRAGSVTIPCHYDQKYKHHVKYWCKGYAKAYCTTMIRTDSTRRKSELSITDNPDQLVFYVNMRNLQQKASDYYWCGVKTDGKSTMDDGAFLHLAVTTDSPGMWTESWSHTESGGSVTIPCHYHQRYKEHVKYWCKGYTWSSCSTMVRSDSPQSKGEVSITDDPDKLVFNVTMRNLQENCSGTFWCGVEINGVPAYGAILVLNVTAGSSVVPQETTVNTIIEKEEETRNRNTNVKFVAVSCMVSGAQGGKPEGPPEEPPEIHLIKPTRLLQ